ncbi:MAG: hypothetical protein Q8S09_12590 [Hyphomonas sp.]|nr:hypothetical protein [Hyphomonas sp.]
MTWTNRIPGCFGTVDQKFAIHPLDEQRAIELLLEAKRASVGYDEVVRQITAHLTSKGASGDHIGEQIARVRKLFKPWYQ